MNNTTSGLPLLEPTSPLWIKVAAADIDALLIDHAHCELKAASTALSIVWKVPDNTALVQAMTALAHEEMRHFERVHKILQDRGKSLERRGSDEYVVLLMERGLRPKTLLDQLILCSFIEARSCERFRILADGEGIPSELRSFYKELASAEDRHHEIFIGHAEQIAGPERAQARIREVAEIEAAIIRELPLKPRMH